MRGSKAISRLSFVLACAAAACGKTSSLADAPAADANRTDAGNTIDADQHGPVTVIVMNPDGASGPEMGVPVAFLEPDGTTLAAEVMTDASGKATADVLPGASVTAVYALSDQQHDLETVDGVKPGDTITIGDAYDGTVDGTFTVDLIDVVGTTSYTVYGPCGPATYTPIVTGSGSAPWHQDGVIASDPVVLTIDKGCAQPTMDLVAVRYVGTEVTDYVELPGVAYTAGGSTSQTAAWTPAANLAIGYSDVPADVTSIDAEDDVPFYNGWYMDATAPISGTTASTAIIAPLATTGMVISFFDSGTHTGEQSLYDLGDGTRTSYSLDVGATLLPWVDPPVLDTSTGKITTVNAGGNPGGDAFKVQVEFQRAAASGSGSGSATAPTTYDWIVWSASVGDVTLPTLPTDLADNDPLPTDTLTATPFTSSYVFDLDLATGYDAVRPYLDSGRDGFYTTGTQAGKLRESYSRMPPPPSLAGKLRARHQARRVHVAHSIAAAR